MNEWDAFPVAETPAAGASRGWDAFPVAGAESTLGDREPIKALGAVTDYGQADDDFGDSLTRAGKSAIGRLSAESLAVSPDIEAQFRASGIRIGDRVQITLADGSTMERVWDDRTASDDVARRIGLPPLRGRFDLYSPAGPHAKRGVQVTGFAPAAAAADDWSAFPLAEPEIRTATAPNAADRRVLEMEANGALRPLSDEARLSLQSVLGPSKVTPAAPAAGLTSNIELRTSNVEGLEDDALRRLPAAIAEAAFTTLAGATHAQGKLTGAIGDAENIYRRMQPAQRERRAAELRELLNQEEAPERRAAATWRREAGPDAGPYVSQPSATALQLRAELAALARAGDDSAIGTAARSVAARSADAAETLRALREGSKESYGVDPRNDERIPAKLIDGAASLVPIVASGPAAPAAAAALMAESGRRDALEHGATPDQAEEAFVLNAGVGVASEALLGIPALLRSARAAGMPQETFLKLVKNASWQAVKSAGREGTQEAIEQTAGNTIANAIVGYDPERGTFDGVAEAAFLGALIGAPIGAVGQVASDLDARRARGTSNIKHRTSNAEGADSARPESAERPTSNAQRSTLNEEDLDDFDAEDLEPDVAEISAANAALAEEENQTLRDAQAGAGLRERFTALETAAAEIEALIAGGDVETARREITRLDDEHRAELGERPRNFRGNHVEWEALQQSHAAHNEQVRAVRDRLAAAIEQPAAPSGVQNEPSPTEPAQGEWSQFPAVEQPAAKETPLRKAPAAAPAPREVLMKPSAAPARTAGVRMELRAQKLMEREAAAGRAMTREAAIEQIANEDASRDAMRQWLEQEQADYELAQNEGKHELLSELERMGWLPAVSTKHGQEASGELKRIWEAAPAARMRYFRKSQTKSLDTIREELNERGFNFETPYDLISAVEARVTTGKPHYGERAVFSNEEEETTRFELGLPTRAERIVGRGLSTLLRSAPDTADRVAVRRAGRRHGMPLAAVGRHRIAGADTRQAMEFAQGIGKRIVWFRELNAGEAPPLRGFIDTALGDIIFLNADVEHSAVSTAAHEAAHWIEHEDPALYRSLVKLARGSATDRRRWLRSMRARGYQAWELNHELVAQIMQRAVGNPAEMARALGKKPSLFARILSALQRFADYLQSKWGARVGSSSISATMTPRALASVHQAFRQAMRQHVRGGGIAPQGAHHAFRPSYGGAGARGFAQAKAGSRTFAGRYDQKERFEIDDSRATLNPLREGEHSYSLAEVLDHPALYDAYPELADIDLQIQIDPTVMNAGGSFRMIDGQPMIDVRARTRDGARRTLLHEVQHAIQEIEGFARGSSPTQAVRELRALHGSSSYFDDGEVMEQYRSSAGEIEARDVGERADMTGSQRALTPPYSSENIAPEDAIVRFSRGGRAANVEKLVGEIRKKFRRDPKTGAPVDAPARPKIERGARLPIVSRLYLGSADVFERTPGLEFLGKAIRKHVDRARMYQGKLTAPFRAWERKHDAKAREAALSEFEAYQSAADRQVDRKRNVGAFPGQQLPLGDKMGGESAYGLLQKMSPAGRELVTLWEQAAARMQARNELRGLMVKDKFGWRKIRKVQSYFPRSLKPEIMRALRNPDANDATMRELKADLIEAGLADAESVNDFIAKNFRTGGQFDRLSNIEAARKIKLPNKLYDYSFNAARRYIMAWSERMAQIEAFGQKTTADSKDLFDKAAAVATRKGITGGALEYIDAARRRAYGETAGGLFARAASGLNAIATGTMLGNPITVAVNAASGIGYNATTLGAWNALKGAWELRSFRRITAEITDAHERGLLLDDLMNMVDDADAVGSPTVERLQQGASALLKWSGYNLSEEFVRGHGLVTAKAFLRAALKAHAKNPQSRKARSFRAWFARNSIDFDALAKEDGAGVRTDALFRQAVNTAQGGYRYDQVPIFMDTPVGRFLFKYQKWGSQAARNFEVNVLQPLLKPGKGNPREILPALRYVLVTALIGAGLEELKEQIFGTPKTTASLEEIARTMDENERRGIALAAAKLWRSMLAAGATGLFGNYAQMGFDVTERSRFKSPMNPPGLSLLSNTGEQLMRLLEQGRLTLADYNDFLRAQVSQFRTAKAAAAKLAEAIPGDDPAMLETESRRQDVAWLGNVSRRFAAELGIPANRTTLGRVGKTPDSPEVREIKEALMMGDRAAAKEALGEYLSGRSGLTREFALDSLKDSIRSSQPARLATAGEARRQTLLAMAKRRLSADDVARIERIDRNYRRTAAALGLMKASDTTLSDADLQKAMQRATWRSKGR